MRIVNDSLRIMYNILCFNCTVLTTRAYINLEFRYEEFTHYAYDCVCMCRRCNR